MLITCPSTSRSTIWTIGSVYGTIEARSADAALRKVVDEYQISDPETLKRLAVRPIEP
jgi:hypothetical protein